MTSFSALATAAPRPGEPDELVGLIELALVALEDTEYDQAIQHCEKALGPRRDCPEALYVLGLINMDLEDPVTALKLIETAHNAAPDVQEYAEMLAAIYASLGNVAESLFYAKLGTSLSPHSKISGLLPERYGTFFYNLERGRSDLYLSHARRKLANRELSAAVRDCETQLELTPDDPETLRVLAECCLSTGDVSRAVATLESVVESEAVLADDLASLGEAVAAGGDGGRAVAFFRQALERAETREKTALFSRLLAARLRTPGSDDAEIDTLHEEWRNRFASTIEPRTVSADHDADPQRTLRIGYISGDFYDNDLMTLLEPVLHSHQKDDFEVYCYADSSRSDLVTERIQRAASNWCNIERIDDETLWQILRGDKIDITVDLSGHGPATRALMLARRPSPITLTWLNYLHPPGLPQIDYFLADETCCPSDESTEDRIWRLDQGVCTFLAPPLIPDVGEGPAASAGHATFGAQCDLRLVDQSTAETWANVLRAAPGSRLLLGNLLHLDQAVVERCREKFGELGVADRVSFMDLVESQDIGFGFYRHIDIALDPPVLSTIAELCRALWMGVPILTVRGSRYATRRGASLLTSAGRSNWIAQDAADLAAKASKLVNDLDALAALRKSLREETVVTDLGNPIVFTRRLEEAYREMWRRWCADRI